MCLESFDTMWHCKGGMLLRPVDGSMQRRLLIGIGLTGAAVALALIPTAELRGKPSKPLFFYLTPLVRIQASLSTVSSFCTHVVLLMCWSTVA